MSISKRIQDILTQLGVNSIAFSPPFYSVDDESQYVLYKSRKHRTRFYRFIPTLSDPNTIIFIIPRISKSGEFTISNMRANKYDMRTGYFKHFLAGTFYDTFKKLLSHHMQFSDITIEPAPIKINKKDMRIIVRRYNRRERELKQQD